MDNTKKLMNSNQQHFNYNVASALEKIEELLSGLEEV